MNRLVVLILVAVTLTACASRSSKVVTQVSKGIEDRTGHGLNPNSASSAFAVPPGVLLADGLAEDEALAIALWNNAAFQADLTALGFAQADLIEAGQLRNPMLTLLLPCRPRWRARFSPLLHADFRAPRLVALVFVSLPFALVGGVIATLLTGGTLSLGSLVGFVTVLGIAARNGIMLVSHYRHLEFAEGQAFGQELVVRGSEERLAPILMTALATGLALLPIVIGGNRPGHEIEHPMAVVILGGLVTSTLLNLFLMPALYLRFGTHRKTGRQLPEAPSEPEANAEENA